MKPGPRGIQRSLRRCRDRVGPLIKDIVRVSRDVLHRNPKTGLWSSTSEVAYYVVNCPFSAHRAAAAIRSHWYIENKLHYTRDVTFQEDYAMVAAVVGRENNNL